MQLIQMISLVGALMVLTAFTVQQMGHWRANDYPYLTLNAIGAFVLSVIAFNEQQWGFLLMETVWTLVSVYGLMRRLMVRA